MEFVSVSAGTSGAEGHKKGVKTRQRAGTPEDRVYRALRIEKHSFRAAFKSLKLIAVEIPGECLDTADELSNVWEVHFEFEVEFRSVS
jgi:hypothetical protein